MPPVKREHSPSPTPYDRIKTSKPKPKATPKPEANSAGRKRLIEMVIERGIAAVMGSNIATTQAETGLTVKQIQNHLGKGRSLRARLEEVAKIV
ncbi:hypothetical protein CcaverHIS002_0703020 [Cutaneotrichosporon cavernicola]|nr:hypothetical protein CcaverHIS002_0703020 [Cutaneotrichosporon cavernicola]BEJ02505.1 hypothetical protein CcaverHIS631_0703000 [Cutaneotrichosporon cavernicola]